MQPCFFLKVGSCAKFHVLSQLIVLLVLLYRCLQVVYFNFMYFVISMFIGNPLTSIQVLYDCILDGTLNGLGLVLLIKTK